MQKKQVSTQQILKPSATNWQSLPLSKKNLLLLLENKKTKIARTYIGELSNSNPKAQKIIKQVMQQIFCDKKCTTATQYLYALVFYKNLLLSAQLDYYEDQEFFTSDIHNAIADICLYNIKEPIKAKGTSYFTQYIKPQTTNQKQNLTQLGHSVIILSTQLVQSMANWYKTDYFTEDDSHFVLKYQQLKTKGLVFPNKSQYIYIKQQDYKQFQQNYTQFLNIQQEQIQNSTLQVKEKKDSPIKVVDKKTKQVLPISKQIKPISKQIKPIKKQEQIKVQKKIETVVSQNYLSQKIYQKTNNIPIDQVSQSKVQVINKSNIQVIDKPKTQVANRLTNQVINKSSNQAANKSTNKSSNNQTNKSGNQQTNKQGNQQTNKQGNQQTNKSGNQQINKFSNQVKNKPNVQVIKKAQKAQIKQNSPSKSIKQIPRILQQTIEIKRAEIPKINIAKSKFQNGKVNNFENAKSLTRPKIQDQKLIDNKNINLQTKNKKQIFTDFIVEDSFLQQNIKKQQNYVKPKIFDATRNAFRNNNSSIKNNSPIKNDNSSIRNNLSIQNKNQRNSTPLKDKQYNKGKMFKCQKPLSKEQEVKQTVRIVNKNQTLVKQLLNQNMSFSPKPLQGLQSQTKQVQKSIKRQRSIPKTQKKHIQNLLLEKQISQKFNLTQNIQSTMGKLPFKTLSLWRYEKQYKHQQNPSKQDKLNAFVYLLKKIKFTQIVITFIPQYFQPITLKMVGLRKASLQLCGFGDSQVFFNNRIVSVRLIKTQINQYVLSIFNLTDKTLGVKAVDQSSMMFSSQIILIGKNISEDKVTSLNPQSYLDVKFCFKTNDINFKFLPFFVQINNKILPIQLPITLLDQCKIQKQIMIDQITTYQDRGKIIKICQIDINPNEIPNFMRIQKQNLSLKQNDQNSTFTKTKQSLFGQNQIIAQCTIKIQDLQQIGSQNTLHVFVKIINEIRNVYELNVLFYKSQGNQDFAKVMAQLLAFLLHQ